MLSSDDQRHLQQISSRLWREDPRFAEGLRAGHPCRPREYRRRRARQVTRAAAAAGLAVAAPLAVAMGTALLPLLPAAFAAYGVLWWAAFTLADR